MKRTPHRNLQVMAGVAIGAAILGASPLANAQVSWRSVVEYLRVMLTEGTYWKLVGNQTRVSASRQVEVQQKTNQQLAGAFDLIRKQERLTDAVRDHGAATGQPKSIGCAELEHADLALRARQQATLDAARLMQSFSDSRQRSGLQSGDAILQKHKGEYCTVSEARQGIWNSRAMACRDGTETMRAPSRRRRCRRRQRMPPTITPSWSVHRREMRSSNVKGRPASTTGRRRWPRRPFRRWLQAPTSGRPPAVVRLS